MTAVNVMADQLDALRARLTELNDEHAEHVTSATELTKTLGTCEDHVSDVERQYAAALERRDKVQGQLDMAEARVKTLAEAIEELAERIERQENEAREAEQVAEQTPRSQQRAAAATGSESAVLEAAERFGEFSAADIAYALELTPKQAAARLANLVEVGEIRKLDRKFQGKAMFEHLGAKQADKDHMSEGTRLVRDFAVKQSEQFTPAQVTDATEVGGSELDLALQELLRMGTIEYVGFDDLMLYQYVKPTEMGEAAERDMKRRKKEAAVTTRSTPVEGTGGKWKISNPEVRQLVAAVENAGGTVSPTASGHYEVRNPETGRKVMIAGTPRNPRTTRNDRARVRRQLQLDV